MNIRNLLLLALGLVWTAFAQAQNTYPNRPIQMIMPLQAGSGVDILMRPITQKMG
jgi:tripartite-type tricarboxylate transporter receptor subunit TctC